MYNNTINTMAYKKNFENWYSLTLESMEPKTAEKTKATENNDATTAEPETSTVGVETSNRTEMMSDVDTIMNQLSKLSVTVKESVDSIDLFETIDIEEELNEEETLIFDEIGEDLVKLQDQIDSMLKWDISDPKWIVALKGIQSACNKVDDAISKADQKLGAIKYNESEIKLNEEELSEVLLERGGGDGPDVEAAAKKVADWLFYARRYRKMQQKINAMKMHAADIGFAKDNLTSADPKKAALDAKKKVLDGQIKDLQSSVDDKAKERGEYIQKVLSREKILGHMELIKRTTGNEDLSPEEVADLKTSMQKLKQRYAEEEAAINQLKQDAKEQQPQPKAEEPKKEKPVDKKKDDAEKYSKEREEAAKKKKEKEAADKAEKEKEPVKNAKDDKLKRVEDMIKREEEASKDNPEVKKLQTEIDNLEKNLEDLKKDPKKNADSIDILSKSIPNKKNQLQKLKASGNPKLQKLKDLKDKISAKESWQLEGTELGRLFEMEISKLEMEYAINESKYSNISILDKLKMLLG